VPVATPTPSLLPAAGICAEVPLREIVQVGAVEKVNEFDGSLTAEPSGPTTRTSAWYSPPGRGQPPTLEAKS